MSRTWSGETAERLRTAAGLRPDEVAEAIGVHRASVYAWEAGRKPQLRYAVALADLFDIALDDLFVHEDQPATPANGRGEPHGPDTAAVGGSAGPASEGA